MQCGNHDFNIEQIPYGHFRESDNFDSFSKNQINKQIQNVEIDKEKQKSNNRKSGIDKSTSKME